MDLASVFALAIGLSMDAMAVAATRGLAAPAIGVREVARVSLFFGGFQAGMPLLGWAIGQRLGPLVEAWQQWIAFVLLVAIGGKMLWEARGEEEAPEETSDLFGLRVMTVLAIATSIDAFAVGVTLPMLKAPMAVSLISIGCTTAVLSALGLFLGRRFGSMLGRRLDAIGGLVLIGLGFKLLLIA
ncbi:MAG: manganese efflux pump MntP family protein [Myxococcota bacterium]